MALRWPRGPKAIQIRHVDQRPSRTITRTSQATIWMDASDFMCAFIAAIVTRSTPALTSSECAPLKQLRRTRVKQSYTSSGSPPPVPSSPVGNPMWGIRCGESDVGNPCGESDARRRRARTLRGHHQRSSSEVVIRGHQWSSVVIKGEDAPWSVPIKRPSRGQSTGTQSRHSDARTE